MISPRKVWHLILHEDVVQTICTVVKTTVFYGSLCGTAKEANDESINDASARLCSGLDSNNKYSVLIGSIRNSFKNIARSRNSRTSVTDAFERGSFGCGNAWIVS